MRPPIRPNTDFSPLLFSKPFCHFQCYPLIILSLLLAPVHSSEVVNLVVSCTPSYSLLSVPHLARPLGSRDHASISNLLGPDRLAFQSPPNPHLDLPPARGGRPTNDRHCCPGAQPGRAHRATNNRRRSSPSRDERAASPLPFSARPSRCRAALALPRAPTRGVPGGDEVRRTARVKVSQDGGGGGA